MRFPIEPLVTAAGSRSVLAEAVGIQQQSLRQRLGRGTGLKAEEADRWACAIGLTPWDVWPEEWGAYMAEAEDEAREKKRLAVAKWRKANPERARAIDRASRERRRAAIARQRVEDYRRNRERYLARRRERYQSDPAFRERSRAASRAAKQRRREEAA